MPTLDTDGITFSDGRAIRYDLNRPGGAYVVSMLEEEDNDYVKPVPLVKSNRHANAVLSTKRDVVLHLDTSGALPSRYIILKAPVRAKHLTREMQKYYTSRVKSDEFGSMCEAGENRDKYPGIAENRDKYPGWKTFLRKNKTYGSLKGNYTAYSGLHTRFLSLFGWRARHMDVSWSS